MPNKERIRLWVEALRSGKYTQGRSVMNFQAMHCCLGVACEVAIENGLDVTVKSNNHGFVFYDNESNYLPDSVSAWLGLALSDRSDPQVSPEPGLRAVRANDELKWNFDQIADSLERMYLNDGE